jgi:hypothetical protein
MKIVLFWALLACSLGDIKVSKKFLASSFRIIKYCYTIKMQAAAPNHKR